MSTSPAQLSATLPELAREAAVYGDESVARGHLMRLATEAGFDLAPQDARRLIQEARSRRHEGREGREGRGQRSASERDDGPVYATLAELMKQPGLLDPPECVIPRVAYRGRLVILAGPDKSGKSTLVAHAMAALSRGERWLGEPVGARHRRAVLAGLEEAPNDAARRLSELGTDPERVHMLLLRPPDLLAHTAALLAEHPADLVAIDSLQEYARVTRGNVPDDGDNAGWSEVVRPLVALARRHDVAVLLLHHVRRSDGQYRGAGEIAAAADALLELVPPGPEEDPALRRLRGRGRWPIEPCAVALRGGSYELAGGGELSVDARVLLHIEAHPGCGKRAIREAVRGRNDSIDAAIADLLKRGAIEDRGAGARMALYTPTGQVDIGL